MSQQHDDDNNPGQERSAIEQGQGIQADPEVQQQQNEILPVPEGANQEDVNSGKEEPGGSSKQKRTLPDVSSFKTLPRILKYKPQVNWGKSNTTRNCVARPLLGMSSVFGLLIGCALLAAGIFGRINPDFLPKQIKKVDLSSVPDGENIKADLLKKIEEMRVIHFTSSILLTIGSIITIVCALGLASAITALNIVLLMYIVATGLLLIAFIALIIILTHAQSVFVRPIFDMLLKWQNEKLVSVVAFLDKKAGDGLFETILINFLQFQFDCCGMLTLGDIRDSSSWRASPRKLTNVIDGMGTSGDDKTSGDSSSSSSDALSDQPQMPPNLASDVAADSSKIPDWLKDRMPPGATLPPGINLPATLPPGFEIPETFNISKDILKDRKKIEKLFENALQVKTPLTCCRFKSKKFATLSDPKKVVANLVDQNCPFQKENGEGVHNSTCYSRAHKQIRKYSFMIGIAGIVICCMLTFNISLAVIILHC